MKESAENTHKSYGMLSISKFQSNHSEFFGSDLVNKGGIQITISKASIQRKNNTDYIYSNNELIRINLSANQYVDAITSAMNTQGVPCTIQHIGRENIPQISHVIDKKEQFSNDMSDTHKGYFSRIDEILSKLEGNIGKRKQSEIKHDLEVLKSHIKSNTNFVMTCFNEAMEKTVSEAKHSISNYIDSKVHSIGIEGLKDQLKISIDPEK